MRDFTTIVIGGGASGLMAAAVAPGGALILEKLNEPGRKLLATGGGRCNFTREESVESIMQSFGKSGRFMRDALAVFGPDKIRAFFADAGVDSVIEAVNRVFPASGKSKDILSALLSAVENNGSKIMTGVSVHEILCSEIPGSFDNKELRRSVSGVKLSSGKIIDAKKVVLATGGFCRPSLGSDGDAFEMARVLGLKTELPSPALTGLVLRESWPGTLSGISLTDAALWIDTGKKPGKVVRGSLLFTHKGISGPVTLDISGDVASALKNKNGSSSDVHLRMAVRADMGPAKWKSLFDEWRQRAGTRSVATLLATEMPRALAEAFRTKAGISPDTVAARLGRRESDSLAELCGECTLTVASTGGREEAMITRGGIDLAEINPKTMESRKISGLFFAGEAVNLDGPCGGYNLTWAFASGYLAGISCI